MDFAQAQIVGQGNNLHVQYGDDKGLLVEFIDDAVYQPFESEQAGRAIYKAVPFISIIYPGDKTKKTLRPATSVDKQRFPNQWQAFEKGGVAVADGTPITEWNYLSKSQALELKHMGFWTVDLLANASDLQISSLIGGHLLRKQAQIFIGESKDDSKYTALVAENERLANANEELKITMESFKSRLDSMEETKKTLKLSTKS